MAKIPQLNYCCCGCSLELGTKILAWLHIIGGWIGFALGCVNLFLLYNLEENNKEKVDPSLMHSAQEKIVMASISSLVSAVIGTILLLGVNKRKPHYVFAYVIFGLLQFLAQIGVMIYLMFVIGAPALIFLVPLGGGMKSPEEIPSTNYQMPGELPKYLQNLPDRLSDSFKGSKIFITGGTGFLGKVLVEKILRKAPDVEKIYLLVRPKRGKQPKQRIDELFASPIFDVLKSTRGSKVIEKVVPICGDVSEPDLAISPEDRKILEENVEMVFHSAATIRFDETLKRAVLLNTRGTMYMLQLAHAMKRLQVFVHISTAYCHLEEKVLEEKAYQPPADPIRIIKTCELIDEDIINSISKKILKTFPNTYAFTKSLSEGLVVDSMNKGLPCIIVRPSVVIPVWLEPLPGWTDNINGPTGLLIGAGKGVLRSMYCDNTGYSDYLPVDLCVNGIIVSAWNYAFNKGKDMSIIHLTSSDEWQITWQEIIDVGKDIVTTSIPLNNAVWYPGGSMKRSRLQHKICVFFFHTLPAFFLDSLLMLCGYKPILSRVHNRINKGFEVFEYYANNQWDFKNNNIRELRSRLNERERAEYKIDGINMDMREYFEDCILAARLYLLKETPETIPAARRHMKRMYWVDLITRMLFWIFLIWFFTSYSGTFVQLGITFYLLIQHNIAFFTDASLDMADAIPEPEL